MATPSMAITLNSNTTLIKQEPQHSPTPPPQQSPSPPTEPQFLKSIDDLTSLSAAIDTFKRRFDELQNHLNFIDKAITARSNELEEKTQQLATNSNRKSKNAVAAKSNVEKLREEVPAALKCAPKPAKLVLDCIGRFYLQGSKAYEKESPMITGREASILVLEFFLLISDHENAMEDAVKKEAEQVAIAWRKRLISEGGVRNSGEIDAKGLLLLIGGFGIPRLFSDEDVFDLVNLSKSRQFAGLVRRSRLLVTRVTDIIEGMMKKGMKVEAVDVACIFGIEDKFPVQKLLTLVLQESREPSEGRKRKANNSPSIHLQKEAKEKQLIALKSVVKFLEEHQLDPTKLLPGWQLQEKTIELEKDIVDLNKKIGKLPLSKRPENVNEVTNYWKSQEIKRRRFAEKGSPLISPGVGLADQIAASYMDGQSSYNSVMRLNGGFPGHVNNYPAGKSAMYGSSLGPFPKNVPGTSASGIGLSAAYGGSAGVHRDLLVDGTGQIKGGNVPHYAWHRAGDTALNDGSVGHWHHASGLFGKSQSIEGFAGLLNSPPTAANGSSAPDLYGFADAPSLTARQSAASDLYGFADAPTVTANHIAASSLYRFPDAVAYGSTRHTGPFPPGLGSLHSSYKR
ncbi:INACTIVE PROTEIN FRIGIDA [Salix purpurea]|uniref:FRIGIDA-like protein n=1 Tax=Salix purpurea TaxID=77065 RepID=A0A9Q1A7S7_SALPP|nr:INACTIVE PROTEIN FRIGIDA [Salix purpurea]